MTQTAIKYHLNAKTAQSKGIYNLSPNVGTVENKTLENKTIDSL